MIPRGIGIERIERARHELVPGTIMCIPSDGAQHKTVVEASGAFLGAKYRDLVNHFETMRRKRNEMTYEAGGLISGSESRRAFNDAIALTKGILFEVKKENPQMKLEFDINF
ncbi:MAG: hypothetical protein KAS66_11065 [Candidatus Omnitrophica bacterium]|nr:hypothetical protein [Candidatus Omnitrophota bacterium]